jgi:hypothetical protein
VIIAAGHRLRRESASGAPPRSTTPIAVLPRLPTRFGGRCCPGCSEHVHLSDADPRRLEDDAAHGCLSGHVRVETGMPVLLVALRTEDSGPLVVVELEDFDQESAEAVVRPAEQPFVEAGTRDTSLRPCKLARTLLCILLGLLEVGAPDVVRTHPRGVRLLGKCTGEIGLACPYRPLVHERLQLNPLPLCRLAGGLDAVLRHPEQISRSRCGMSSRPTAAVSTRP